MHIEYTFTADEFRALVHAKERSGTFSRIRTPLFWAMVAVGIVATGINLQGAMAAGRPIASNDFLPAGVAVLLLAARFILNPILMRRALRQQMRQNSTIQMTIDDEGIATRAGGLEARADWASVQKVSEEPGHIIFWTSGVVGHSVPKAAFSQSQMQELRSLVGKKVTKQELSR